MFERLLRALKDPKYAFQYLIRGGDFNNMPDVEYLKLMFNHRMGYELNLANPKTYNEKLQWLKLHNQNPKYTMMVDKYEVRKYISEIIGEKYLIQLIGVWDKFEDINFENLPEQFVLKCTHDSGGLVICTEKKHLDIEDIKEKINKSLKTNYYYAGREWPYKNIKPRIICEKYIVDESGTELKDYKFMCFNGEPKIIQVMSGRNSGHYYLNHFDLQWNKMDIKRKGLEENTTLLEKPNYLEEMIEISKKLSQNIPFVRIDLYETVNGVFFGEITFYPVSGYMDFEDKKIDYLLGDWIELPIVKN